MKKKILILGSSGFIGKRLSLKLKKKFIIFNSINRKNSFEKIKKFLIKNKIKYIINLVNNNRQKIKMIKYNTNLLNIIKNRDIKIIFFSTSLIYGFTNKPLDCLLYTSDAADEEDSVDLGGRRIIKKIFFKQKTAY